MTRATSRRAVRRNGSAKRNAGAGARKSRRGGGGPGRALFKLFLFLVLGATAVLVFAGGVYVLSVDAHIRQQFEGKRWALPARVYARPLELFAGAHISADQFAEELALLHYRPVSRISGPGTYVRSSNSIEVDTRHFTFGDGVEPSRNVKVMFKGASVDRLDSREGEKGLGLLRMEPAEIAGIYPSHNEDRVLVKREEIPPVMIDALMAVEDRSFYQHWGIDLKGIARALVANLRAGRTVQGGSTLTQQLVKNFFLSNERTLKRKLNEMLMAVLIEWHYNKDEILEAYANEVYLGQDGNRAIHGLGLASRFYFNRPLNELTLHHVALLVGLIRGPSYYDPRRHPDRAKERRALVLDAMVDQGLISVEDAETAKGMPLDVAGKPPSGITPYPAFVDLVRRQLREDYREEDLTSEGLRIFTTLDPQVQKVVEQAIVDGLPVLEKRVGFKADEMQAAAIFANTQSGEVLAAVGGRDVGLAGFNRALDAKRPVGSLLKPAVYLTAVEIPARYTLATLLEDAPFTYTAPNGQRWSPENYTKRYRGQVLLEDALAQSYNVPTARLGLALNIGQVIETLQRLGLKQQLRPFPSLVLGAVDLAPIEVAQIYETFASGGFRVPLRAIRQVTTADATALQRYPLSLEKAIEPGPAYLITRAMQRVVEAGTARAINRTISPKLGIAGKTGTTDDLRDSWFAGFSGNIMGVVWVGRDDNKPVRLSGGTGAMPVWAEIMSKLNLEPLELAAPVNIEEVLIDPRSGLRADRACSGARRIPFIAGSAPWAPAPCSDEYFYSNTMDQDTNAGGYEPPANAATDNTARRPSDTEPISNFFKRLME